MHQERKSELIRNYLWCCVICSSSSYLILAMIRHSAFRTQREQMITEISLRLGSCWRRVLSPEVAQDSSGGCPTPAAAPRLFAPGLPSRRGGPLLHLAFGVRGKGKDWERGD